ncbi:FYVE zinc finger family protein [Loa loa]|uniref:1-phosphatidylinositol-3-phosphate 5-kinase n=1 Tax=Loa loa TaxID=7209 RepID=A0A1S0ULI0_LOALO|nr:FYVE zinc finger family protein [Loa loa]EJD76582.1 FYVE zinc finger family protein [Loa loa]
MDAPTDDATAYITYFAPHPEELADEAVASTSAGIFGNFFNRIFKSSKDINMVDNAVDATATSISPSKSCSNFDRSRHKEVGETPNTATENQADKIGVNSKEDNENGSDTVEEKRGSYVRFASVFKGQNPDLLDYERSDFRRYWMPDSSGRECYECQERFTPFRRRHHCRLCGQIFCSKCCGVQVSGSLLGYTGDLRLCTYCAHIVVSNLPQTESKSEDIPSSPPCDQKSTRETDVSVSTIFAGPVSWSPISSIATDGNNDNGTPLQHAVPRKPSMKLDSPTQLSVAELAIYNSGVQCSATHDVGDDHEPEWVKNIEMTDNVKPVDSSNLKPEPVDYPHLALQKDDMDIDDRSNCHVAELDDQQIVPQIPTSKTEDEDPRFCETIERCFEIQSEKLILHLFNREGLDPREWWEIIWSVSHVVSSMVKVDMEGRKNVNVMKHAHIKSLHVAVEKPSAKVIEGAVCSKSIRHESMPDEIRNASVLTLEGSIEYERVNDKLSSIEPIISQESEYLRNQVERLLSHRPSVVLVERNVAGLAVQMLLRAKVTLVSNIKPRVLQRIARSTGADVMPSLDAQILNQKIGFCPFFRQKKIQLANGKYKCLLMFEECPPELGCSVLLRGNSKNDLRAAKRILHYAILTLYSNHLEVKLLSSCGTTLSNRSADCDICSINAAELDTNKDNFCNRLKKSTLSPSPLINFGIPFLETSKGRRCSLRKFFSRFINSLSVESNDSRESSDCTTENYPLKKSVHPFVKNITLTEVDEDAIASFRAFSGCMLRCSINNQNRDRLRKETVSNKKTEDVLDPFAHQQISVLFGSFCAKSSNAPLFCIRPWVVNMNYYGVNDMSLGDFLRKYCFNRAYQCPSTNCDLPMMEHSRRLVHRNVCVEITTQNYVHSNGEPNSATLDEQNDTLFAWHYCPKCKSSSSVVPLTESICRLSFARYLNYLANGAYATCKINSLSQKCEHCCFHQHERNIALNNLVTTFKVLLVRPFHVTFSPLVCAVEPMMFTRKFVAESKNEIQEAAAAMFKIMSEQIDNLSKYSENSLYSTCHAQAVKILRDACSVFSSTIKCFDPSGALAGEPTAVRSNDAVYIQAFDTICRCRYIVQHAINLWNEQCQYFSQQIRTTKKCNGGGIPTEANKVSNEQTLSVNHVQVNSLDFELIPLKSPFLAECHFSLPLPSAGLAAVVVRDVIDRKGATHPDIGSIIAYALSSVEYNTKRRKQRDSAYNTFAEVESVSVANYEHIEVDFADDRAQYYVKVYYAERFHMLRKLLFVEGEDCFMRSLSSSRSWSPQSGKSGASFYRTQDDRFVFKQMSWFEIQSFVKFGPNYFSYVSTAMTDNKLTTLCKVYGVYRICYKNKSNGQQLKVDVLVMEYLFYRRNVKQVWDLKGSQRNRMASEGKRTADLVLLDENLVKDLWNNQLYVHPHSKAALSMAISNDSHFLSAQHIMDYSLLVGVDETNSELILGIVDYMRTYTLDKKLESWVKIVAIPGAHLPTVISPEMYCTRFFDAIDTYFPVAPDQWTGFGSALSSSDC